MPELLIGSVRCDEVRGVGVGRGDRRRGGAGLPVRAVFAVGRGQYGNIGDVVLRRQLLQWVSGIGRLHVYVGRSPAGYDEGLQLVSDAVIYRSLSRWYCAAMTAALRGRAAYAFKPGEIQLTMTGMKEHLVVLPLLAALRLRGGRAVRAGVGSRNFAPVPRALLRPSVALSDVTLWRDERTAAYLGVGGVMPDLAFAEGAPDDVVAAAAHRDSERDVLVVSLRAEEPQPPYPGAAWVEGVRRYAAENELQVWAVTQVRVDDGRTRRLAADLGGQALTWPVDEGHWPQELALRALFRRSAVVLSDRLHVLVAAFTEGALPVGLLTHGSDKVDRHFTTIRLHDTTVNTMGMTADDVVAALRVAEARRPEMVDRLLEARAALRGYRSEVRAVLGVREDVTGGAPGHEPVVAVSGG